MATVAATNPPSSSHGGGGTKIDTLKQIDMSQLSQSELQSLAFCSDSSFDVRRSDDVVTSHLDPSLFNESAGSRRQTFSRLHHRSHSRFPGLHPSIKPHRELHASSDPVTHSIVHFFKHFVNGNHNPPPPPPLPPPPQEVVAPVTDLGFPRLLTENRKRVRKSRVSVRKRIFEDGVGVELQKVNAKGEVVDLSLLGEKGDELYSEELKRRTEGLETEESVLGFLGGLDGPWCSRRRKRKYVDAGVLGDALPIGWKILLGLRRRDYHVSVYCRRYISPSGQHFLSCREAASFLTSYFVGIDADQQRDQKTCSIQQAYVMSSSVMDERPADKTDATAHDVVALETSARSSTIASGNDDALMGIENLPEVQVQDIFECSKCNLTFYEKNVYLKHLFSSHQKTTKRYRLGTPIGEGVIIKDGKYECQFCHKVFEEKRSYSGHVGIHVRNSNKNSNELPPIVENRNLESPMQQEALPSKSLKMDASNEIAQSSIFETPEIGTSEQPITNQSSEVLNLEEYQAVCSDHEPNLISDPIEIQADLNADRVPNEHLSHGQAITENNDMVNNDYKWNINVNMDANCLNDSEHVRASDIGSYGNTNLDMGLVSNDHLEDTPGLTVEEMVFQDGVSSVALAQPFQFFPSFGSASNKVEHEFSIIDQKLENVTGFEELRFDDMEPFKYGYVNGQGFSSLPGCSMNLGHDSGIEDGFNSSVRFHTEEVMLNTMEISQLTVCVWCRTEFRLEGIESESPSDSIGYMCPTCKAKISGHFGGGLSLDPHGF